MAVWRLQIRTGANNSIYLGDYCLKNNIIAMGWVINKSIYAERAAASKDWNVYYKQAIAEYGVDGFGSVIRLHEDLRENDLIWMRVNGIYYIGRITADSHHVFDISDEATKMDAGNQYTNIHWYKASSYADEDTVPGAVNTAFIKGSTLQRIRKPGVEEFSQMLYNQIRDVSQDPFSYPIPKTMTLCQDYFYSLLQPSDVEDLLCMWLYKEKGYICIPSTNKISTQKYECVLVDPNASSSKHIYIQVKNGDVSLDANDYADLPGEVYLLTTKGQITNLDKNKNPNVHKAEPKALYDFAVSQENNSIIPESIMRWISYLAAADNAKSSAGVKGIMFDTNRSYSDTDENDMLKAHHIAAYGNSARYIKSFNKDDYALFYSKGRGVIAIGRIISDHAMSEGKDDLYQDVEMIVPDKPLPDSKDYKALSPMEIKKLLNRGFYFASTIKTPYLTEAQVHTLIDALKKEYE